MARVDRPDPFTGTIGNICFYKVGDSYYARAKSSLTRKRVLKSKAFEKTRQFAGDLASASSIASLVYRQLPVGEKGRPVFRAMTGEAASLLYRGNKEEVVKNFLRKRYLEPGNDN